MKCSLCGYEFSAEGGGASGGNEKDAQASCKSCPLMKGCGLIRCPNCGFETPPEPGWLKHPVSLNNLGIGQKGKVARIHTKERNKLQKLMAMGVLPGIAISLIQKFPSYVFQIGHSQFAVDKELAECIFVRKAE